MPSPGAREHALPGKECVVTVRDRRADVLVSDEELARRSVAAGQSTRRGYAALYQQEILQAGLRLRLRFPAPHAMRR
jgi:hypothetical protein